MNNLASGLCPPLPSLGTPRRSNLEQRAVAMVMEYNLQDHLNDANINTTNFDVNYYKDILTTFNFTTYQQSVAKPIIL